MRASGNVSNPSTSGWAATVGPAYLESRQGGGRYIRARQLREDLAWIRTASASSLLSPLSLELVFLGSAYLDLVLSGDHLTAAASASAPPPLCPGTIPSSRDPFPLLPSAPFQFQLPLVLELQIRELQDRPPWWTRLQSVHHLLLRASGHQISKIIYNRGTDQSRGYGFVTMSTVEQAEKAVEIFHHSELNGRLMTVNKTGAPRIAQAGESRSPHRSRSSSVKIYVGNLPWNVDGSRLKRLFSEYGDVFGAEVVYDYVRGAWRSRGFGFVTMVRREEAEDAIWDLDMQASV